MPKWHIFNRSSIFIINSNFNISYNQSSTLFVGKQLSRPMFWYYKMESTVFFLGATGLFCNFFPTSTM